MLRVVLDTNVLVSALFWEGNERKILRRCKSEEIRSVTSPVILEELERVLMQKFKVPQGKVEDYLKEIVSMSDLVFPKGGLDVIEDDPTDDLVIETALLGRADLIVTGDKHLLGVGGFEGVGIKRARDV